MATNMKENGFETLIVRYLVDNNHYEEGLNSEYNKTYAIDEGRLFRFLNDTQYKKMQELRIEESEIEKKKFLDRLSRKLSDDGVINIIRKGVKYKNHTLDFYMVQPSDGNVEAAKSYNKNIFSVTRQLRYSGDYGKLALDLCIFLNGLPIITMELKNQYTKQNYSDAIKQYKTDRTPDELLFQFKRCIVHFAVDDNEVHMCTELKRDKSFFLPFNKGNNNGAGNPNNPNGIKTDYLWKDILAKDCLANILENYVQITEEKDEDTGHKSYKQIFPRYHQLSVVTSLLADAKKDGPGHRYLIQHSAGSGKSNSIAWLAHQLVTLQKDKKDVFDTIIVVTDRINLDKVIENSVQTFSDNINEFNGMIGERQVGCPLVVHRRCIEPMFSISNLISYDNRMFNKTNKKEEYLKPENLFLIKKSGWINVEGEENGGKDHFVKNQAERVCQLMEDAVHIYSDLFETDDKIFIITPFRTVAESMRKFIISYFSVKGYDKQILSKWTKNCVGTVHTFQGKDANEVLLVLGCSNKSTGAMNWVVKKANILNVACTRAKYRIAFIGNINDWKNRRYFREFIPSFIDIINV